jgi:hypothetical protein
MAFAVDLDKVRAERPADLPDVFFLQVFSDAGHALKGSCMKIEMQAETSLKHFALLDISGVPFEFFQ